MRQIDLAYVFNGDLFINNQPKNHTDNCADKITPMITYIYAFGVRFTGFSCLQCTKIVSIVRFVVVACGFL